MHITTHSFSFLLLLFITGLLAACDTGLSSDTEITDSDAVDAMFNGRINLNELDNYAAQDVPNYVDRDNTERNSINNVTATLGRVLFYDTMLSSDQTISCASCHKQSNAFGDPAPLSEGVNGTTGRHSMRLINARFADEENFFWDERAQNLEAQTTLPIRDHIEMGFSGAQGAPDFNDLIARIEAQTYYNELFSAAFGDPEVTETRMQNALAQFVRSIQSFDSKFDIGRAQVNNNGQDFPNFTALENRGKALFLNNTQFQDGTGNRVGGGLGCGSCHRAPTFDITPNSDNNGFIELATGNGADLTVTRSPSLRDLFNPAGELNSPLMHTGSLTTMDQVLDHYNSIQEAGNNQLDRRLSRGNGNQLNLTAAEREAVIAFLKTLSGTAVYEDARWSDPF
ncbi:MAG: cytochrome-c peroxidase [Bacteroidota bacterium]